jgi:aldehyde dehydrogenase (NAD+)
MAFPFSKSNLPEQLFINNEYVNAKGSKKLTLVNPRDGSVVSKNCPIADEQDVNAAVAAAEKALPAWKKLGATDRRNIMYKFAELVDKHSEALSEITRITLGAPYGAFGKFEVGLCSEVLLSLRFG